MRTIDTKWRELTKGYHLVTQLELDLQVQFTRSLNIAQRRKNTRKLTIVFREKILSVMGNNSGVHWAFVLTILTHHA
jgi:hypothetical protein